MVFRNSPSILLALGAATLLLLPACDSAVETDDTGGTTGGSTSDSTSGPPATSSTTVPATSSTTVPATSSTGEEMTSSSTSATTTEASSSTGEPGDCVDEDIGDAVGEEVASGTNDGQGDDFVLRYCDGGVGSSTSASTVGPDDSGGGEATTDPTEGTTDPTEGTTGMGSGTTGGFGDSGDDYVVSWTPPGSGPFVIDTFGSGIDTVLSVVAPECGASRGDCNDDCEGFESGLVYEASEGETVFIVIEGYSGRQGSFVLNIAQGDGLECGGFETDGPMTTSTSAGTSAGTSP